MYIKRDQYLKKLIRTKENGRIKIITGVRRCGKSYLLFHLYYDYLISTGVQKDHIIELALDELANAKYRNPVELDKYVRERMTDEKNEYYVFLDEIQFVRPVPNPYLPGKENDLTFVDTLLGLMKIPNADVYVTGSNSHMLSSDIVTQFRDRADEIRVYPLSYAEFCSAYHGDMRRAWPEYYTYGGMPYVLSLDTHEEKSRYLQNLFSQTYIRDVLERHNIKNEKDILDDLINILASSVGSLTNPTRLSNTFLSEKRIHISNTTVSTYIDYFVDAYLLNKAERYDVKDRKYINTPSKYYFIDPGLRNARLGFHQIEETHLMENVIYNDLIRRGYDVDVGVVTYNTKNEEKKSVRKQLEIDFVVNRGGQRIYVQSALTTADPEKRKQETASLILVPDSFSKIVITGEMIEPQRDENGINYINVEDFLLSENIENL